MPLPYASEQSSALPSLLEVSRAGDSYAPSAAGAGFLPRGRAQQGEIPEADRRSRRGAASPASRLTSPPFHDPSSALDVSVDCFVLTFVYAHRLRPKQRRPKAGDRPRPFACLPPFASRRRAPVARACPLSALAPLSAEPARPTSPGPRRPSPCRLPHLSPEVNCRCSPACCRYSSKIGQR